MHVHGPLPLHLRALCSDVSATLGEEAGVVALGGAESRSLLFSLEHFRRHQRRIAEQSCIDALIEAARKPSKERHVSSTTDRLMMRQPGPFLVSFSPSSGALRCLVPALIPSLLRVRLRTRARSHLQKTRDMFHYVCNARQRCLSRPAHLFGSSDGANSLPLPFPPAVFYRHPLSTQIRGEAKLDKDKAASAQTIADSPQPPHSQSRYT